MPRIIIDTDPGQDDAFALLLALASPELEILGVTTVAGNVPVTRTAANARAILELAGRAEIAVRAGAERPILRSARTAVEVHGATGIDGWDWPTALRPPEPEHAVDWMVRTLLAAEPASVTVVCLGPQTNLALALTRAPAIAQAICRVLFMGGGFFEGGNMTPAAEYNILVDPEAAAIVLRSGIPCTAVPLDCTHSAPAPDGWAAELDALGTAVGAACAGMLRFFERYGNAKYGTTERPLHDALAVGWLLWPELYEGRDCPVEVELQGRLTTGMTVVDYWRQTGGPDNCLWLVRCEAEPFYTRMLERLAAITPTVRTS